MPRFLYSLVLFIIQPLVLLRLFYKGLKAPAYRARISERYGFHAPRLNACIWVHAVSVGEAITAKPLIESLLVDAKYPILVTTATPTGAAQVQRMFGDRVLHRYLPQDISWCLKRFIKSAKPRLLLVMETELWPNLMALSKQCELPCMLVNGRLSEKSAAGYGKLGRLTANMLKAVNTLCVQTQLERDRFISLGARPERCVVVPSLKFEPQVSAEYRSKAAQWQQQWRLADRFVWIAASTHPGEDEIMLVAHQQLLAVQPKALLVLAPRHPERFNTVAELVEDQGLTSQRFSAGIDRLDGCNVLLLDAMGQLMTAYGLAHVAFVGGSLNGGGGHNIMEPALWSLPVLSGPGLFNFQAVSDQMQRDEALAVVSSAADLGHQLQLLLASELRQRRGGQAYSVAQSNKGGLALTLSEIAQLLPP